VLYSNSTVVFELFGFTVAFKVAVVPELTPVAASVVAEGELASSAESTYETRKVTEDPAAIVEYRKAIPIPASTVCEPDPEYDPVPL
jgi:hypothetical protein